jgi:hypothetical protein
MSLCYIITLNFNDQVFEVLYDDILHNETFEYQLQSIYYMMM